MVVAAGFAVVMAEETATRPADNLQYWLDRAEPATQTAESRPARQDVKNPLKPGGANPDAVPGVVELSDGTVLAGDIYTTTETPLKVFVGAERRWRRVPLPAALSVNAVVVEEEMRPHWRFGEMGRPEKFYTGKEYPYRRFLWKIHLADDTYITGAIKGQPIWVEHKGEKHGPFLLHERSRGPLESKLEELVYLKRIVVSRRCMERLLASREESAGGADGKSRPPGEKSSPQEG